MASKTFHVYISENGTWIVKKEGKPGKEYPTKREAVAAAKKNMKVAGSGQFAVHAKDGHLTSYGVYKMPKILDPHKKSSRSKEISRVIGLAALERVKSDKPREQSSQK